MPSYSTRHFKLCTRVPSMSKRSGPCLGRYFRGLQPRSSEQLLQPVRAPAVSNESDIGCEIASIEDRAAFLQQAAGMSRQRSSEADTAADVVVQTKFDWKAMYRFQDTLRSVVPKNSTRNERKRPHYDNRQRAENRQPPRRCGVYTASSSIVCSKLLG